MLSCLAAIAMAALSTSWLVPAHAARSTFRAYDADQGLVSVGGFCMLQDRAGYVVVCTEHGVFAYDGRRFVNLGPDQGLRSGGIVFGVALTAQGRIAVEYSDEVLVSDRPSDAAHPPSSLWFSSVRHDGIPFNSDKLHRLAPWKDSVVLLAGGTTVRIALPDGQAPQVESLGYDRGEQALLRNAQMVFSVRDHLWEATDDGLLCAADPGAVRCYGEADGLSRGPWMDVVAADGGDGVLARSASSVATFSPGSNRWSVAALPDQGDRYLNYTNDLGLFRAPDGAVVTQADHGLAVLRPGGWQALSVAEGAPPGTIVSAMTDATGQFWLQTYGQGLLRWVGYGHRETLGREEGLSEGLPWQSVRLPDGAMWVATDTGIDEIPRGRAHPQVDRVIPGPSFALALGPQGRLWASYGAKGVHVIDPADGSIIAVATPPVDAILPDPAGFMWIGTEEGLFRVDARARAPGPALLEAAARTPVPDIMPDGAGGIFYLADHLRHRHADGTDAAVTGAWPAHGFSPLAMAFGRDGTLWAGGAGGLFQLVLSGDRVSSFKAVPTSDTQSNTILAVMVDHRGWVWTGTSLGVSVSDGRAWASVDADTGLLSNDVQQLGLREDPDGSVWISTSRGLTHLLDPPASIDDRPLKVLVSTALLGNSPVRGRRIPYTDAALSLQFGTPNYAAERSVVFRYRLSGSDADWAETSTGAVRYAFVPPGRHVLTVIGIDRLTHRTSSPCSLVIDIAYPWWRQWWAEAVWALCALGVVSGAVYGVVRLRLRAVLARQAELKRHVAEATAQLHARTEELHHQAAHDSLTGLLNRSEVERRLARALAGGRAGDELIVALLDIDHFKRINDRHGHLGGDDVLRAMGCLVADMIGRGEFAGRYGGEEILLVLQDGNGTGAGRVLGLHRAVEAEAFKAAGAAIAVTCSIGLTWAVRGDDWESLIGRADEALYHAKTSGRNRVIESPRIEPDRVDKKTGDTAAGSST